MSLTGAAYALLPVKDVDRGAMTGMAQLVHTVPEEYTTHYPLANLTEKQ